MRSAALGDFVWVDPISPDPAAAIAFQTDVMGWKTQPFGDDYTIRRISRFESGSPAAGSHGVHGQEQEQIVEDAVVTDV